VGNEIRRESPLSLTHRPKEPAWRAKRSSSQSKEWATEAPPTTLSHVALALYSSSPSSAGEAIKREDGLLRRAGEGDGDGDGGLNRECECKRECDDVDVDVEFDVCASHPARVNAVLLHLGRHRAEPVSKSPRTAAALTMGPWEGSGTVVAHTCT